MKTERIRDGLSLRVGFTVTVRGPRRTPEPRGTPEREPGTPEPPEPPEPRNPGERDVRSAILTSW